jgi:chromosome partitioning protein
MKTVTFAIQKGGQGKTALCTHLVEYAAAQGMSVLAVDLDGQGNFSRNLQQDEFDRDLRRPALG